MPDTPTTPKARLLSLDAFRGLDIMLMFLVNVAGRDPAFPAWFAHRGYNEGRHGNGLADFVFPWFLFIVGCAIPLSMSSGRGKGKPFWAKALAAFRRALVIYLLGSLMWAATIAYRPDNPDARWNGPVDASIFLHWDILPLIAFGYLVAVLASALPRGARAGIVAAILAFKWLSLTQLAHPDAGTVVWTNTQSFDQHIKAQLGWWGVLITQGLPAAATVMLGALAADELRREDREPRQRSLRLVLGGLAMTLLSYAWHRADMPYSKDFLTSSYVLLMAGTGAAALGAIHYIIDVKQWTTMAFARVMGLNALAMYVLAEFLWKVAMVRWQLVTPDGGSSMLIASAKAWLQHWTTPTLGSWLLVTGYIVFYWCIALRLHQAKIYIKV